MTRAMHPSVVRPRSQGPQAGFSLLEVLIAVLIISLGLLGFAGLQTVGLKNNVYASQRTLATQLALDITERMRANNAAVLAGDYNYATYSGGGVAGATTAACLTAAGCTSTQLAREDIYEWNQQICATLPQTTASCAVGNGPWGVVCIDSTANPNTGTPAAPACTPGTGAPYVIKIWWREDANLPGLKLWTTTFLP